MIFREWVREGALAVPVYERRSTRAKYLQLVLRAQGIEVVLPSRLSSQDPQVLAYLQAQRPWMLKTWARFQKAQESHSISWPIDYLGAHRLPWAGSWRELTQRVVVGRGPPRLGWETSERLVLVRPEMTEAALRRWVLTWYAEQTLAHVRERVGVLAPQLGLRPRTLRVRGLKSRWGSCSPSGDIEINWWLRIAPTEVLDYVIAHEMAHLRYRGHGPRFWAQVRALGVAERPARAWLRVHGLLLMPPGMN